MRKRTIGIATVCMVLFATVAWADNTFEGFQIVRVIFNGEEVVSDVPAVNFFGRTLLPVRKLAEVAGLTVDRWDADTNTVYLSSGKVATVNGEAITTQDLYNRLAADYGAAAVDDLIRERLVEQAARQANITVTAAEIDQEIDKIRRNFGSDEQMQAVLQQNNLTMERLRNDQAFRLKVTRLMSPSIPTSDEVLRPYFEANKARFDTRQVRARHILVATEQEAKEIKAQLDKGADFTALAQTKSIDPTAKSNGGDLGRFGLGQMVPEFERVVFGLNKGEISQPFKSQFGWHIAQVTEQFGSAPVFETSKADVRAAYVESQVAEHFSAWLADLKARATITNSLNQK